MKKILYNLVTAIVVLSMGMFCSCSEDNEGIITATEDDFPQILLPWFGDWTDGVPAVYKSISRDAELIDSAVVTPALYTAVEWFIDDELVCEGKNIHLSPLPAGEYILKIVATTTKGKQTSRTGILDVLPLEGDPTPGDVSSDRLVMPGMTAKLHGTNMENVVKITIGGKDAATTFVSNNGNDYVEYTVPADLALGTYRITLTDSDGNVYGGGKIEVSDELPAEEVLWEGLFDVTWDTPFRELQTQFIDLVKSGDTVCAYVTGEGQGTMATDWWSNILTGKTDPERGDITISGSMVLEFTLTDYSIQLMNEQNGAIFVGNGYTITKITKK